MSFKKILDWYKYCYINNREKKFLTVFPVSAILLLPCST